MDALNEFREENNAAHENLPLRLKDSMLDNFIVNGVMPITMQTFQNSILLRMDDRINALFQQHQMGNNNNVINNNNNNIIR